jgi:acyl-CoA thioesterase
VSTGAATEFDRATAVAPLGDGAWSADCDPGFWVVRGPNGGYLAALVLRAMVAELDDPAREPRSLTCHYLRPPANGPVRVDVTVERSGRSTSSLTARLTQDGRLCVVALGAFALDGPGPDEYAAARPSAPPPEAVAPLAEAPGRPPIFERFEVRPAVGQAPFTGSEEAVTGGWLRLAEPRPLDAVALAMYADAWMPSPYVRLSAPVTAPTIDLTVHFRAPRAAAALPPDEPVLAVFRSTTAAGGFFEEDGELWTRDGVLLAHSRQLALLTTRDADPRR